jgi:N4-gp56 family major capsid protein
MADQKSVVEFRENSRDLLAYWLSDRIDQLAFLTMSGVAYTQQTTGQARVGSDLPFLEFAADVVAPSSTRYAHWNNTTGLLEIGTGTSAVVATDIPTYKMLVQAKAYCKDNYIRGIKEPGGEETFHCFMSPGGLAALKTDPDYINNLRYAGPRDKSNELFAGGAVKVDGIYLHEFRHVYNTRLAASGSKWGAGNTVDGQQALFCGAQAMGFADIGVAEWVEKGFDYENSQGISTGKIIGMIKPQFVSQYSTASTPQDFGIFSIYTAIPAGV